MTSEMVDAQRKIGYTIRKNFFFHSDEDIYRPTFGCPLDVHLKNTRREIATVIEDCVLFLYNNALDMQVFVLNYI